MSFDAGDIQGRLTLDRTPFTRELDKAQRQAKDFSKAKYTATLDADRSAFTKGVNLARAAGVRFSQAKYAAKLSADRHELTHALKKAAEDVRRFNKSNQGAGTSIGVNEADFNATMKRINASSRQAGITVANNFQSPLRKIKWPAIFAGITAAAVAIPPALIGVGGAVAALAGAFTGPVKALSQFNKATDAMAEGADNASQELAKYNGMMAKLTPEGRAFVTQAQGMRDEMSKFGKVMQRETLPGFTGLLQGLEDAAPAITRGAGAVGGAVSDVAAATGELFRSPIFQGRLERAFENSVPVVRSLGMAVRNLFRDMTTFTASTRSLGMGLAGMIDNVSDGFTSFFQNMIPYSDTLGQAFEGLGGIFGDLLGALGTFSGIISTGFGPGLNVMRDALSSIYDVVNSLLAGAMPGLTTAFSGFASVIGGVATVLAPLAPLLGSITGFLAPFALALKAIDMLSFGRIGQQFSLVKAAVGSTTGAVGKAKVAFSGLAAAGLGPLGLAAAGLGVVLTLLGQSQKRAAEAAAAHRQRVQELTQTIIDDGGAVGAATKATIAKSLTDMKAAKAADTLGISFDKVTAAAQGNGKAYQQVSKSLKQQGEALAENGELFDGLGLTARGAEFARLAIAVNNNYKATKEAAVAALELKAVENGVTTATIAHWNALNQLNSALMASVDKSLAYREAQLQLKQAQEAVTESLKTNKKSSTAHQLALVGEERAINAVVVAAGEKVRAANATLPPERQNKLAMEASQRAAFKLAETYSGPLPKSLRTLIGGMDSTSAAAMGAKDKIDKAGHAVRVLPNGKTVRIVANADNFWSVVRQIQSQPIVKAITFSVGPLPSLGLAALSLGRAKGGIDQYADGGMTFKGRRVQSMSSRSATSVAPGTPRIIGDNYASRESFIPHDKSRRSQTLLSETNRMMGDPLGVNRPEIAATGVGGAQMAAAVVAALENMDVTISIGGERINEMVEVSVGNSSRKLITAVRAGTGRSR